MALYTQVDSRVIKMHDTIQVDVHSTTTKSTLLPSGVMLLLATQSVRQNRGAVFRRTEMGALSTWMEAPMGVTPTVSLFRSWEALLHAASTRAAEIKPPRGVQFRVLSLKDIDTDMSWLHELTDGDSDTPSSQALCNLGKAVVVAYPESKVRRDAYDPAPDAISFRFVAIPVVVRT